MRVCLCVLLQSDLSLLATLFVAAKIRFEEPQNDHMGSASSTRRPPAATAPPPAPLPSHKQKADVRPGPAPPNLIELHARVDGLQKRLSRLCASTDAMPGRLRASFATLDVETSELGETTGAVSRDAICDARDSVAARAKALAASAEAMKVYADQLDAMSLMLEAGAGERSTSLAILKNITRGLRACVAEAAATPPFVSVRGTDAYVPIATLRDGVVACELSGSGLWSYVLTPGLQVVHNVITLSRFQCDGNELIVTADDLDVDVRGAAAVNVEAAGEGSFSVKYTVKDTGMANRSLVLILCVSVFGKAQATRRIPVAYNGGGKFVRRVGTSLPLFNRPLFVVTPDEERVIMCPDSREDILQYSVADGRLVQRSSVSSMAQDVVKPRLEALCLSPDGRVLISIDKMSDICPRVIVLNNYTALEFERMFATLSFAEEIATDGIVVAVGSSTREGSLTALYDYKSGEFIRSIVVAVYGAYRHIAPVAHFLRGGSVLAHIPGKEIIQVCPISVADAERDDSHLYAGSVYHNVVPGLLQVLPDSYSGCRIICTNSNGFQSIVMAVCSVWVDGVSAPESEWGRRGIQDGELETVQGICVAGKHLYVLDRLRTCARLQVFE